MSIGFVDLHTHSTASDGSDSPAELIRKACAKKLIAVALTDHDTFDGLAEAEEQARQSGVYFIRGCEFAARHEGEELHFLGYWLPEPSATMQQALDTYILERDKRNRSILEHLQQHGIDITMEEVHAYAGKGSVGRPHIAGVLIKKKYVHTISDAFTQYLGERGKAFIKRALDSPKDVIKLLKNEGATVVFAHPCLQRTMTPQNLDGFLEDCKSWGLDGIEAYHSAHTAVDMRLCVNLAEKYNLLLTGGSDYHGKNKPGILLGSGHGGARVPSILLDRMIEQRKKKGLWVS